MGEDISGLFRPDPEVNGKFSLIPVNTLELNKALGNLVGGWGREKKEIMNSIHNARN
jgi:hypothetical protein